MRERIAVWTKRMAGLTGIFLLAFFVSTGVSNHASAATGDWNGAKKAVIAAYQSYKTEVDVSSYNLNYSTEYSQLSTMMSEVVNRTPYLFYAGTSYTVSRKSSTNQIVKIGLGYADSYKKTDGAVRKKKIKSTRLKLDAVVASALTTVNKSMSSVEKALVLHDYLVSHTTYSANTSKQYRLTEIGALINKKANCQGYSLAYAILLEKAGLEVDFVSSESMSHMWNIVKINGKWYNVDVTWDDPVDANESKDQYGVVKHNNFLCSASRFTKNGHYGFTTSNTTSTKYDSKYWKSVNSSFFYSNGKWLYLNKTGLVQKTSLTASAKTVLYNVTASNLVQLSATKYYFIAYNNIYLYDVTANSANAIWKTGSNYSEDYTLVQIKYADSYLYYRVISEKKFTTKKFKVTSKGAVA